MGSPCVGSFASQGCTAHEKRRLKGFAVTWALRSSQPIISQFTTSNNCIASHHIDMTSQPTTPHNHMQPRNTPSHHITSYDMTSHDMTSRNQPHHLTSPHLTTNHIESSHLATNHMTSYHTTSHHRTSHHHHRHAMETQPATTNPTHQSSALMFVCAASKYRSYLDPCSNTLTILSEMHGKTWQASKRIKTLQIRLITVRKSSRKARC